MAGLWHLSDLELLSDLGPEGMQTLEQASQKLTFDAGETVFRPAAEPKSVYLLMEGAVRIYRLSDKGAEATLGYVKPGEVFGELTAVTDLARESYAEAAASSIVWRLPIDLFREMLGAKPGLAQHVSQQLGTRLKSIERRVEGLVFHDARNRLASILHELADHFGIQKESGVEIDGDFTQAELATLVGCTRQTLNQALHELEAQGLLQMRRRRVILPDPEKLRGSI